MNGKAKEPDFLPFVCYGRISSNACLSRHLQPHPIRYLLRRQPMLLAKRFLSRALSNRFSSTLFYLPSPRGDNNSRQRFSLFSSWRISVSLLYIYPRLYLMNSHDLINTYNIDFFNFSVGYSTLFFAITVLARQHEFEPYLTLDSNP